MSLKKKLAIAFSAAVLAVGGGTGVAYAVNGVDNETVSAVDAGGKTITLHSVKLTPVFEKQNYQATSGHEYYCWALASIKCPIPVRDADKPAYDSLKQQLKK